MRTLFVFGEDELKRILARQYEVKEEKVTIINKRGKITIEIEMYNDEEGDSQYDVCSES